MADKCGKIIKVSGPLIVAEGMPDVKMYDVVRVSEARLIGEVIELRGDKASVQVYEETSMLGPGENVYPTGAPLSVELGPGLLEGIYDGIQRPLRKLVEASGNRIGRGIEVPAIDREKKWKFVPTVGKGDKVQEGDIIGTVRENEVVECRITVPNKINGTVKSIKAGEFTVEETVAEIETEKGVEKVTMLRKWPVRRGRPYKTKLSPETPLVTGQRVIDTLFPIARGGVAAVPGPFGSGKTVVQHQLA